MVILAAGCAAYGLALNGDPVARRRALRAFAVGHLALGVFVWFQWAVYWRSQGLPLAVASAPLAVGVVLLAAAIAAPASVSDGDPSTAGLPPGSYDEHIRRIARREERARLARDLHDAVKQQLFVIQTAAATAQARFDTDPAGARMALAHVRTAAGEATTEMTALLEELQAAPIENVGLVESLKTQCEALAYRTGAEVLFTPDAMPPDGSLPAGAHEAVYRVAQEALANVARHARATRVTVSLGVQGRRFELHVSDNGVGLDREALGRGMGTSNMSARAAALGGYMGIATDAPGTTVSLTVPLRSPAVTRAWFTAWLFALLVLSFAVFYGLRGHAPETPALVCVFANGLWAIWRLISAYRHPWPQPRP